MVINLRCVRNLIKYDFSGSHAYKRHCDNLLIKIFNRYKTLNYLMCCCITVVTNVKAFDRKDKIPSYLTTNILKLSAAIHLNFEHKIFVDLNLFFRTTYYINPYMGIGLWCWVGVC